MKQAENITISQQLDLIFINFQNETLRLSKLECEMLINNLHCFIQNKLKSINLTTYTLNLLVLITTLQPLCIFSFLS